MSTNVVCWLVDVRPPNRAGLFVRRNASSSERGTVPAHEGSDLLPDTECFVDGLAE